MEQGARADELTIKLVEKALTDKNASNGFVLDGFPRTIPQAEALGELLEARLAIDVVINSSLTKASSSNGLFHASCASSAVSRTMRRTWRLLSKERVIIAAETLFTVAMIRKRLSESAWKLTI